MLAPGVPSNVSSYYQPPKGLGAGQAPSWCGVASRADASGKAALDPTPPGVGVLLQLPMASAFRRAALERHSSESLDRISTICYSAWVPLSRLAELADQILTERQAALPQRALDPEILALLPY